MRLRTAARAVGRHGDLLTVETDGDRLRARHAVLAVPADALATLLDAGTDGRSRAFAQVPYAPVVVVALGFRRDAVRHPLDGFGFLAPWREGLRRLGCLFPSSLFPGRAPEGRVALAAFLGDTTDRGAVDLDDAALRKVVLADLDRTLGLADDPVRVRVRRWPRAIPQYERGHGRVVDLAERIEAAQPGLAIGGNVLGGVSVADCVRKGTALAEAIAAEAGGGASPFDTAR